MKLLLLVCLCPCLALAQGQFLFDNHVGTDINAPFEWAGRHTVPAGALGPEWSVVLRGAPSGSSIFLSTTLQTTSIEIVNGYAGPAIITVPNVPSGAAADIWMTFEKRATSTAPGIGGDFTEFPPWTIQLGGSDRSLPYLPMGTSPLIAGIPEPCTLVLFVGGITLFLVFLRKQKSPTKGLSCSI